MPDIYEPDEKYANSKIYIITSPFVDTPYIGSTYYPLEKRFDLHKYKSNRCSSKDIIKLGWAKIELLHDYPCNCRAELKIEEGRVMRLYPNRINKQMEGQTEDEQRIKHNERRRNNQEYKDKQKKKKNEARRNMSQEHKNKENERQRNRWQEQKDKCNEARRKNYAAKKAAASLA